MGSAAGGSLLTPSQMADELQDLTYEFHSSQASSQDLDKDDTLKFKDDLKVVDIPNLDMNLMILNLMIFGVYHYR